MKRTTLLDVANNPTPQKQKNLGAPPARRYRGTMGAAELKREAKRLDRRSVLGGDINERPKTRVGKKMLSAWVDEDFHKLIHFLVLSAKANTEDGRVTLNKFIESALAEKIKGSPELLAKAELFQSTV